MVEKLTGLILGGVKSFQKEQILKLDCCYAMLMRLAIIDRHQIDDPFVGHRIIQKYFQSGNEESIVETLCGEEEVVRREILEGIKKFAGKGPTGPDVDWKSHEVYGGEYRWIRADVLSLVLVELEGKIPAATVITKIFHGLPSPNFKTKDWKGNQAWAKYISIPFETLASIVGFILLVDYH
jgi:hypothetical protein